MTVRHTCGTLLRTVVAALWALCTLSCVKAQRTEVDPDVALTFDPVLYTATKATGVFPVERDFGISAWDYSYAPSDHLWLSDERITQRDGIWAPSGEVTKWPAKDRSLAVLAWSPFAEAAAAGLDGGVEFRGYDSASGVDLLYCDLLTGLHKDESDGVIPLAFKHALCLVDFRVRTNAEEKDRTCVASISLPGVACKGDFRSLPQPQWTLLPQQREVVFFSGEQQLGPGNSPVGESLWLLPQKLITNVRATIKYDEAEGIRKSLEVISAPFSRELKPGRHYTITMTFKSGTATLEVDNIDENS